MKIQSRSRMFVAQVAVLAWALSSAMAAHAQDAVTPDRLDLSEISYVSGGIGSDESDAMKAQASNYSLALTFAQHLDGQDVYLASVPVVISNAASGASVLDIVTEGPYLLVNLPEGHYRIAATYQQSEKAAEVKVGAGGHERRTFVWAGARSTAADVAPTPQVSAAVAAAPPVVAVAPAATSHLPPMKSQGNVRYLTGGIGSDESNAIKAAFGQHALVLTLASRNEGKDVFLANVPVVIRDADGTIVLDAVADGPYLLADLPPGTYEVAATYKGEEKRATARVAAGKPARLTFLWVGGAAR